MKLKDHGFLCLFLLASFSIYDARKSFFLYHLISSKNNLLSEHPHQPGLFSSWYVIGLLSKFALVGGSDLGREWCFQTVKGSNWEFNSIEAALEGFVTKYGTSYGKCCTINL